MITKAYPGKVLFQGNNRNLIVYDNKGMKNQHFAFEPVHGVWFNEYTQEGVMVDPNEDIVAGANVITGKRNVTKNYERMHWKMVPCGQGPKVKGDGHPGGKKKGGHQGEEGEEEGDDPEKKEESADEDGDEDPHGKKDKKDDAEKPSTHEEKEEEAKEEAEEAHDDDDLDEDDEAEKDSKDESSSKKDAAADTAPKKDTKPAASADYTEESEES